jgi:hypothetical protein
MSWTVTLVFAAYLLLALMYAAKIAVEERDIRMVVIMPRCSLGAISCSIAAL